MALPFLAAAAAALPAVTGAAGGFLAYNRAGKMTPQEREAQRLGGMAQDYLELSMNPNDPRFKAMVEAESGGIRSGFLQQVRDLVEANRRQAVMGRTQFFDPERRDANAFSAINKAGQQAQLQARGSVFDRINNAINSLHSQQQNQLQMAGLESTRRQAQTQAILGGLDAFGKVGTSFSKFNMPTA